MSWNQYVEKLMFVKKKGAEKEDAAIVGYVEGQQSVWAAHGNLKSVTPDEVRRLVSTDRDALFQDGPVLGGVKCRMINDLLLKDEGYMIVQTKSSNRNMVIAKSLTALVMLMGGESVHGGLILDDALEISKHLKENCKM